GANIGRLGQEATASRPIEDRGHEAGDFAVTETVSPPEGGEPKSDNGHFKMGEETPLPELHDALSGKKPGETASFDKFHGDDAQQELWRGKNVHHDVTLKEI